MSTPEPMEDFDGIAAKYAKAPVTFGLMARHLKVIGKVLGEAVRGLRSDDDTLRARVDALEAKAAKTISNVRWAGVYEAGHE